MLATLLTLFILPSLYFVIERSGRALGTGAGANGIFVGGVRTDADRDPNKRQGAVEE